MGWGSGIVVSCVGHRCCLDPVLLQLWYRPTAVAPILALAWELLYVDGSALKSKKKKKEEERKYTLSAIPCGLQPAQPQAL